MNGRDAWEGYCDIYRLARELRIPERKIIDFNSPTNPLGVSGKIKAELRTNLKYLHNYPDDEAGRLRKRLAQFLGIDPKNILCGNGSTELIYLIARTLRPCRAIVTAPTYSGYEKAMLGQGNPFDDGEGGEGLPDRKDLRVLSVELSEATGFEIKAEEFIAAMRGEGATGDRDGGRQDEMPRCRVAFLCNPNNPTGGVLSRRDVMSIADAARESGCYLVVDEAFIDFSPEESVVGEAGNNPYLIVLRSMSFFYAIPGLRFGYGVFPPDLIGRLERNKEPWTVNSLAQRAAAVALKDKAFRRETLRTVREERQFLEKNLRKMGIEFFPSVANFFLVKIRDAGRICQSLRGKGILAGGLPDLKGLGTDFMRIAVKSHRENAILIKALREALDRKG